METCPAVLPIGRIKPNPNNARTHSRKQILQIARSIREFGFAAPILVDEQDVVIAGHGRLEAAKSLGLADVPVVVIKGLSDAKKRALMLADNRIAQSAGWDREKLAIEIAALPELLVQEGLDFSIAGFEAAEIDLLTGDQEDPASDPIDEFDGRLLNAPVTTMHGDLWQLGKHRLLCGDARQPDQLADLMGGDKADMAFLDPPYNVKVGSVVGRGARKHREFAMASGEMTSEGFVSFLTATLGAAATVSAEGALHYVCMDWRHLEELLRSSRAVYQATLNLIAWVKSNAGQGSFYRSQHEMIGVFRVGNAPHLNNIALGKHGRNRSNVWHYAGVNSFRKGRLEDLKAHPTVKPVGMVVDAMKDCTRRGQIVLDSFCGSGTTLLAAERACRHGRGLEIDPAYVDLAIRRWQEFTGRDAMHSGTGLTFEQMAKARADEPGDGISPAPTKESPVSSPEAV